MKKNILLILFFLLTVFKITAKENTAFKIIKDTIIIEAVPQAEKDALKALYDSTTGTGWWNHKGWDFDTSVTSWDEITQTGWYGITVTDGHVTNISLNYNNLVGTIPIEIGQLNELLSLILSNNKLTGTIPSQIETLVQLQNISLTKNQLTGGIPPSIGQLTALVNLDLSFNQLEGAIPSQIETLAQLQHLTLYRNKLTGAIPASIGQLTMLIDLDLNHNLLTGIIPPQIETLGQLQHLSLANNQLSGAIPTSIEKLSGLLSLDCNSNQLTGTIPSEIEALTQLQYLSLNNNQLTGTIPISIGQLNALIKLDLSFNQLTGTIPLEIETLTQLQNLSLNNNQLTGTIPANIGQWNALLKLDLSYNQLTGPIPLEIGLLTQLQSIYLNANFLNGSIPNTIGQLKELQYLSLARNQLSGSIPSQIGDLTQLQSLWLDNNNLTGNIPLQLGNLKRLYSFNIENNQLTGSIPSEIKQLKALSQLRLSNNQLTGTIPDFTEFSLLSELSLGRNKFRFIDFPIEEFQYYKTHINAFFYGPQASIDELKQITKPLGGSVTLKMHEDDWFSPEETYQWFKGNSPIPGATARTYTLTNLTVSNEGDYYCVTTHPIITNLEIKGGYTKLTTFDASTDGGQTSTSVQTPTGWSNEVGITEGELAVSATGAATYTIPIAVPPGINGVIPKISLTYNSQGGNGIAGYGWNISGVSTITRIPSTQFHDGIIDAVDFDSLDRFALDGQRLIAKSGTYGANGTVYETENFSNIKITSYGVHPNGANYGPAYFLIEYPDGSKAYYGNSTDSISIMEWSITYWENPQSVRVNYSYYQDNNNIRIEHIKYGSIGANTPINKISFAYSNILRHEQAYVGGQSILRNVILGQIIVTANDVGFRNYILAYNMTSLGYQRLASITEYNGDKSKNYNPTIFNYDNTEEKMVFSPLSTFLEIGNTVISPGYIAPDFNSENFIVATSISGEFGTNGKSDMILFDPEVSQRNSYILYPDLDPNSASCFGTQIYIGRFEHIFTTNYLSGNMASGYKVMPNQAWCVVKTDDITDVTTFSVYTKNTDNLNPASLEYSFDYTFPRYCWRNTYSRPVKRDYLTGDFNGDGLTDAIIIDRGIDRDTYVGHKFICKDSDIDGDNFSVPPSSEGKVYLVNLDKRISSNNVTLSGILDPRSMGSKSMITSADVNGDGKSDIIITNGNGTIVVFSLDENNNLVKLQEISLTVYENTSNWIGIGDYNGDGKADYGPGIFSTGNSFILNNQNKDIPDVKYIIGRVPVDYNNDGKSDVLVKITDKWDKFTSLQSYENKSNLSYSLSNQITTLPNISPTNQFISTPIFKRNNQIGITGSDRSGKKLYYITMSKDFNKEKLLRSIVLGNGTKETITYSPLTPNRNETYTPAGQIENYPNVDITDAPNFYVVSKLERQGSTGYKQKKFKYYGAVTNMEGLGFMGFRLTMRTNWYNENTIILSDISKFDIAQRGANTENYSVLGVGPLTPQDIPSDFITKSILTYTSELLPSKVFKIKNTVNKKYNGLDTTSSETTTIHDNYNNPTQSTTILKEGNTTVQTTVTNVTYDNQPSGSVYYIGRPTNKTQSVTVTGDTMTNEEQYTYANNLLTQTKKKGHNTDFITEDNGYDSFGNITTTTITAPGLSPRVSSYEYDTSGRFLKTSKDIEGLATTYDYNINTGVLNFEINPYGLKTTYDYDSWFKKIKTTDYLGKRNRYIYNDSDVSTDNGNVITMGDDDSYNLEVFDNLRRKTLTQTKDVAGNYYKISYLYDIYDRKIKTSEPYFGTPSQWNEVQYDTYGRVAQTISSTGKTVDIRYSGLTTTVNDGSKIKVVTKNAMGNIVSVTDTPGGTIHYTYFANGNLKTSTYEGTTTSIEQDGWGRKTKLTDPSAGVYTYAYNSLGETTSETGPNGTTTYTLDDFGKVTTKTIVGNLTNSNTVYTYDTTTKLLLSSQFTDKLDGNVTTNTYEYDSSKRLYKTIETTPYATFTKQVTFDVFGRVEKETSTAMASGKSSSKTIKNTYKNGAHWQIIDDGTQKILWQTNNVNTRGQLTTALLGNGITITNKYDPDGFSDQIKYDKIGETTTNIMTLTTVFDSKKENLVYRHNSLFSRPERFDYDSSDRLISYNRQQTTETQTYDNRGRITQNSIGTYDYSDNSKPYQNTSVTLSAEAETYYTAKPTQNVTYNTFKSLVQIEETDVDKISFTYNDDNSRSAQFYGGLQDDKLQRTYRKYYSADGSMEIKHNIVTGAMEFVTYISGDGYSAPIVLKSDGISQNYLYLFRDYQGSIVAITDDSGAVVEKRLFDAWGAIVKVEDGVGNTLNGLTILDRGYTGHEHLQSVGLIHMNARLYDPKLHRFLQPDNYVQDPYSSQGFNRYSYVLNNPFKYTDSSGELWETLFGFLFSAYVHGAAASGGEANPLKWDSTGWTNAALAPVSVAVSSLGTEYLNNYVEGYTKSIELKGNAVSNGSNGGNSHSYVADIHMPTQHRFLGINMTGLSEGNFFQRAIYEVANSFNIPAQYMMGRSVGDGSMRNLNGTATTTDEGVMAFGTLPLWFGGGGGAGGAAEGGGRVFWSGEGAMNNAMNYAKSTGGTTLEMTRAGQNLQNLITTRNIPWAEARPMWVRLSSVYAKGAKGSVHFFPGATVNPGSIWLNTEKNILLQNGVNIISH